MATSSTPSKPAAKPAAKPVAPTAKPAAAKPKAAAKPAVKSKPAAKPKAPAKPASKATSASSAASSGTRRASSKKSDPIKSVAKKVSAKGREGASAVVHLTRDASFKLIDSQRAIWLAGLGAFAKANAAAGSKGAFESLVKAGASFETQARGAIDTNADRLKSGIDDASSMIEESIDRVGSTFDAMVEETLDRLGFPKGESFQQLFDTLQELSKTLEEKLRSKLGG